MPRTTKPTRRSKGEGTIHYDDARGIYIARVTVAGKRHAVSARTKAEVVVKLDDLKRELRRGAVITKRVGLTVGDVLDYWQTNALPNELRRGGGTPAPGTFINHAHTVRRLKGLIGSRPAAKLTVDDVEAAYRAVALGTDKRTKGDRKPSGKDALQRMQGDLRRAVKDGVRRGVLSDAVQRVVDNAQLPVAIAAPKGERIALTPDEMRSLIEAAKHHRLYALFLLSLSAGLRPGEVSGLCWDDLHLDANPPFVELNHALQRQANNRFTVVPVMKNSGAYRNIELTPVVVDALRRHRKIQTAERLAAKSWPETDLVFASTRGTVLNPRNVAREYEKVCAKAGVPTIVPYETRHTFATMLSNDPTVSDWAAADLLGHTNVRMFSTVYRKQRKDIVRGLPDVVARNLGGS